MYNRYIPQSDGSYHRKPVGGQKERNQHHNPPVAAVPAPQSPVPEHRLPIPDAQNTGISGFLKQLLPKEFDTGDLMIVLLLLLMAGDNEDEKSNALLTLALYFFM